MRCPLRTLCRIKNWKVILMLRIILIFIRKAFTGGVQYVRNSDVVTSVIYNCPNTLNGYNFRLIFIIEENYLLSYLAEAGDIDTNAFL